MSTQIIRHMVVRGGVQGVGYRAFVEHEALRHGVEGWVRNNEGGGVQGVGYRAFVEHEALRHGVEGWVRNRRDGSVEAVFAGAQKKSTHHRGLPARTLCRPRRRVGSARGQRGRAQAARAGRCVLGAADGIAGRAEQRLEFPPQHHVDFRQQHRNAEIG